MSAKTSRHGSRVRPHHGATVGSPSPHDAEHCSINNISLFDDLSPATLRRIRDPIDALHYPPETPLCQEGGHEPWIFSIQSGLVKVVQYFPGGKVRILRLLHAGDIVGMERLEGGAYQHTYIAINNVSACRIPIKLVKHLAAGPAQLCPRRLAHLNHNLYLADFWIAALSTGTVRERMGHLICLLAAFAYGKCRGTVTLLRREDMGAILGVTVETVSREIAALKRRRILHKVEGDTYAYDKDSLGCSMLLCKNGPA